MFFLIRIKYLPKSKQFLNKKLKAKELTKAT